MSNSNFEYFFLISFVMLGAIEINLNLLNLIKHDLIVWTEWLSLCKTECTVWNSLKDCLFIPKAKKYVEKLPSSQNIEFVGPVSNVQQYLEQSRIFTLSSFFEGNPISVLEAMSVGLPVVLPNVGGIPNVVVHGRNGLLFESGDKTKMIQYFEKLTIDQNLYNKMVQNNINDVKKYSIKKGANEYLKIFNQYK